VVLNKIINQWIKLLNNFKYLIIILMLFSAYVAYKMIYQEIGGQAKKSTQNMVLIPGGEYLMGSENPEAYPNEKPIHKVKVDSFLMDKYEVTNSQFEEFIKATGYITTAEKKINWDEIKKQLPRGSSKPPDSILAPGSLIFKEIKYSTKLNDESAWWKWKQGVSWKKPYGEDSSIENIMDHPVVHVSWDDAVAYANWIEKRLPTEAEWEWAAKGGKKNAIYPWGIEPINKIPMKANFWQGHFPYQNTLKDGYEFTSAVGSFPSNDYGLFDMAGNVWEWCSDFYNINTYTSDKNKGTCINPEGPEISFDPMEPSSIKKVIRGGSFLCNDSYCSGYRITRRMSSSYDTGLMHTGFRCVKNI
jgi:formylglycine-generating enzyme required for sulfatase activity|tara:strand:- start:1001 stop:2077 length:1077 start_codon:yes stop_codon:yes gene_type:complete